MDSMAGDRDEEERQRSTSGSKRGRKTQDVDSGGAMEDDWESSGGGDAGGERGSDGGTDGLGMGRGGGLSTGFRGLTNLGPAGGDKAEIIRRRNCENARKARARKKIEVSQLQEQAAQLKQANARAQEEARTAKDLRATAEDLRKQTLRKFLRYRCTNEKDHKEWAQIVEETFTMTLPITPYRWFNGQDVLNNSRVLFGIEHLITDNGSLAVLIESLGSGTLPWRKEMAKGKGHGVKLICDVDDDDIIVMGDTVMCCFVLRTTNAVEHGAKCEWLCRGMMSAKFNPVTNKIAAAEHVFDVTSLMQQLQTSVGDKDEPPVVPNTPGGACQPSREPRVITTATPPFTVVRCNESWTKLCGYSQESIQGRTLGVLQGPSTDAATVASLKSEIQLGHATSSLLVNYKHDGSRFLNYLRVYPLIGDDMGNVTHFLGVLQEQAEDPEAKGGWRESESKRQEAAGQSPNKPAVTAKCADGGKPGQLRGKAHVKSEVPQGTKWEISAPALASPTATETASVSPSYIDDKQRATCETAKLSSSEDAERERAGSVQQHLGSIPQSTNRQDNTKAVGGPGGNPGSGGCSTSSAASAVPKVRRKWREDDEGAGAGDVTAKQREEENGAGIGVRDSNEVAFASPSGIKSEESAVRPPAPPPPPLQGPVSVVKMGHEKNEDEQVKIERRKHMKRLSRGGVRGESGLGEGQGGSRLGSGSGSSSDDRSPNGRKMNAGSDTNSLGVVVGLGTGDSPNPFLAWEDVLAGPGDPLEDLGALNVDEQLDEAGTRVIKGLKDAEEELVVRRAADDEGKNQEDQEEKECDVERARARSDSVMAVRSNAMDRAWRFSVGRSGSGAVGVPRGGGRVRGSRGCSVNGSGGMQQYPPEPEDQTDAEREMEFEDDVGERGSRAASDGGSWGGVPRLAALRGGAGVGVGVEVGGDGFSASRRASLGLFGDVGIGGAGGAAGYASQVLGENMASMIGRMGMPSVLGLGQGIPDAVGGGVIGASSLSSLSSSSFSGSGAGQGLRRGGSDGANGPGHEGDVAAGAAPSRDFNIDRTGTLRGPDASVAVGAGAEAEAETFVDNTTGSNVSLQGLGMFDTSNLAALSSYGNFMPFGAGVGGGVGTGIGVGGAGVGAGGIEGIQGSTWGSVSSLLGPGVLGRCGASVGAVTAGEAGGAGGALSGGAGGVVGGTQSSDAGGMSSGGLSFVGGGAGAGAPLFWPGQGLTMWPPLIEGQVFQPVGVGFGGGLGPEMAAAAVGGGGGGDYRGEGFMSIPQQQQQEQQEQQSGDVGLQVQRQGTTGSGCVSGSGASGLAVDHGLLSGAHEEEAD